MRYALALLVAALATPAFGLDTDDETIILRGDVNSDLAVNVTDLYFLGAYLYQGGPEPSCQNQADVDNSGAINITDMVRLSDYLYGNGAPPPAPGWPGGTCAQDDAPFPGCDTPPMICY